MTSYERLLQTRRDFHRYAIVMIALAVVLTIPAAYLKQLQFPAFMLYCLGLYCASLANFQRRLADIQAQLDMLRAAKGQPIT